MIDLFTMAHFAIEQSGAFVESFVVRPTTIGVLDGLRFAVKDLIDVAGHRTGCGNPTWRETHPPAAFHAVCVEQLLAAGAECIGKTVTDEVAFSLLGENHFYGTPLNPAAPDRVPGGSSSGSASAVACGLAEIALGTDTGGSVRIPASNCGIWGWRPTHGRVSVAGVMPFAPTLDTVGLFARDAVTLRRAAMVLLGDGSPNTSQEQPSAVHLLKDAFALADPEVQQAFQPPLAHLHELFGARVRETELTELCPEIGSADLMRWVDTYRALQGGETLSSLGAWIAAEQPEFGPATQAGFEFIKQRDRSRIGAAIGFRESCFQQLRRSLGPRDVICIPTSPTPAPRKTSHPHNRDSDYYRRTLSLTAIAGVGRLPQITMPLAAVRSAPVGLSLIGAQGEDEFLLHVAEVVAGIAVTS